MPWKQRLTMLAFLVVMAVVVRPDLGVRAMHSVVELGIRHDVFPGCDPCLALAEGGARWVMQGRVYAGWGVDLASPYVRLALRPAQEAIWGEGRYRPMAGFDFAPRNVTAEERRSILEALCTEKGLDQTVPHCWQLFEAICRVESWSCRQDAYNPERDAHRRDGLGGSYGWFQFRIRAHHYVTERRLLPDPLACAYDFHCSADWAMDLAIRNGIRRSVTTALYRHNGAVSTPMRERYLRNINARLAEVDGGQIVAARD